MTLSRALAHLGRWWSGELQMSAGWLAAHRADYDKAGVDQICTQWPIDKLANETHPRIAWGSQQTRRVA